MAIHGTLKNREEYIEFLGCSYERLMDWLEYNFHGEMDWNNMGSLWHVDHILPCSSFDFSIKQDIHTCFHWSNLAPALAKDNLSKSNKIIPELIEFFRDRSDEFSKLYQTKDSQ
jgi:hypothetical protein